MTESRSFFYQLLPILLIITGCASSQDKTPIPEQLNDLVQLRPSESPAATESPVYVDSARVIHYAERNSLLIMGSFPDGCTHIGEVRHRISGERVHLTLAGWRSTELTCTQALVSYSFIYEKIPEEQLNRLRTVRVNETDYPINR